MFSTRNKKLSNRRFRSQLANLDCYVTIGDAANNGQQSVEISGDTIDQEFTANTTVSNSAANDNTVNVQTSERYFGERIDREMVNIVNTVVDRIQNAMLTAIDNIIITKIE